MREDGQSPTDLEKSRGDSLGADNALDKASADSIGVRPTIEGEGGTQSKRPKRSPGRAKTHVSKFGMPKTRSRPFRLLCELAEPKGIILATDVD